MKFGIIGSGRIGQALKARLESSGAETRFIGGAAYSLEGLYKVCDEQKFSAVFLTISTMDKGEAARSYIMTCLMAGVPYVVTCEKGSWSYHASVLKPFQARIGSWAVVGGGSQILPFIASHRPNDYPTSINLVANGTLNFLFTHPRGVEAACAEAIRLGYAEPGAKSLLEVVNGEYAGDLPRKLAALHNILLAGDEYLLPDAFGDMRLSQTDLDQLTAPSAQYRCAATLTSLESGVQSSSEEAPFIARARVGLWRVAAGFMNLAVYPFALKEWLPDGVGNAARLVQVLAGGESIRHFASGPGAGITTTVNALVNNYKHLANIA